MTANMPKLIAFVEVAIDRGEDVEILRADEELERPAPARAGSSEYATSSRAGSFEPAGGGIATG